MITKNIISAIIFSLFISGCAYRIQPVAYGIDEMPPSDREVMNEVLDTLPVCQQWTWNNPSIGRSYTVKTVAEQQQDVNTYCKIFSISTVYNYASDNPYRKHKKVVERACKSSYNGYWVYEPTDQLLGFKWDGYTRIYTKNNVDAYCASRNRRTR